MRKLLKSLAAAILVASLVACGGGGGSAGTTTGSSGTSATAAAAAAAAASAIPKLTLELTDSAGTVQAINAVTSGGSFFIRATVVDAAGVAVPNTLVSLTTDSTIGTLASAAVLTNAAGVGRVQISPTSLTVANAAQLSAQATVNTKVLTATLNYQTSAANVAIGVVSASPNSISALQSTAVTASVSVNGLAATAGQVSVTFSASCGTFSPATATTSSAGVVNSTYQSTSGCSGAVSVTASAPGASPSVGSITVAAAQAANILFSSATPASIVVSSATGIKQSAIKFKVVDGGGTGMAGQSVTFSLDAQSSAAGVTFNVGGALTAANQSVSTDSSGFATVIIQSGTLPTPVIIKGSLTASMLAFSSGIVVTSGKASQNNSSLSATKLNIEGLNFDGVQTVLTMRASDRQGNPIPAGTAVTFVASHGTIQGSCLTDANSGCSATYTSSGQRPASGLVQILAYMDGEESFVDSNGNNIWESGETFYDMGVAFRDDNNNGSSDVGEQTYPGGQSGSVSCASNLFAFPSVTNTCDGTWSSSIRVRRSLILGLSPASANITLVGIATSNGFTVNIASSSNPAVGMSTGSTVSASVGADPAATPNCAVKSVTPTQIQNSAFAGNHTVQLNNGSTCSGARIDVKVTSSAGIDTIVGFLIP